MILYLCTFKLYKEKNRHIKIPSQSIKSTKVNLKQSVFNRITVDKDIWLQFQDEIKIVSKNTVCQVPMLSEAEKDLQSLVH